MYINLEINIKFCVPIKSTFILVIYFKENDLCTPLKYFTVMHQTHTSRIVQVLKTS